MSLTNRFATSGVLRQEMLQDTGKGLSCRSVRCCLFKAGYEGHIATKKPFISEKNRKNEVMRSSPDIMSSIRGLHIKLGLVGEKDV